MNIANIYLTFIISVFSQLMREYLGESHEMEIEDLRENMWADVKGTKIWSDFMRVKTWSEKIWSSLKGEKM